jgi:hypothetical protein
MPYDDPDENEDPVAREAWGMRGQGDGGKKSGFSKLITNNYSAQIFCHNQSASRKRKQIAV